MAITSTARFAFVRWGADTDTQTRTDFVTTLDQLEALGAQATSGTLSARPAFGLGQRFYYATDTGFVYYDTGTSWVTVNPATGFGTTATADTPGQAAAGGSATTASRSDHTHSLPSWASSVTSETAFGQAASAGSASTFARGDHTHGTPATPTKTVRVPHTVQFQGNLTSSTATLTTQNQTAARLWIPVPTGQTATLVSARYYCNGSITVNVLKNGTAVTGLNGVAVSSTVTSTSATGGNTFANNDQIDVLVATVTTAPSDFTMTLYIDYTV